MFTADMAVHNAIGDSFRGATWVSIHNGGGVGWGEVINGGFGMLLDGSDAAAQRLESMLHWDVNNGVARRAWGRNSGAYPLFNGRWKRNQNSRLHYQPWLMTTFLMKLEVGVMSEQTTVYTDGTTLSPQEVLMVAKQQAKVAVSEDAWPSIHAARAVVNRIVTTGETVYGINTGFGALVP